MADAVVSFVVERLGDLLIEQVIFLRGVRDEVEWLRNKLEYMLCFLKDAEEKQDGDHRIQKWISDIRDVAYDAEDIIDNFILKVEEGRDPKMMGLKAWFKKYLCICSKQSSLMKQATLYGIGTEINSLKNRLEEIQHNQEIFKIGNIGNAREECSRTNEILNHQRRGRPYEDNEIIVGFKADVDLLMSELMKDESHRCVVSIVGMGGLGKTTIARKLYNTNNLRDKFKFSGWVSVSKDYNVGDLLRRIIKSLKTSTTKEEFEMLEKMKEEDLESYLRNLLNEGRYLVVLDDIWDVRAWASLRGAFPDNRNGSRIIITTREKVVANLRNERTYVHELPFLGEVESWELFCKKVLPNCNEVDDKNSRIPPDLESMAKDMVKKCRGLPLAIVVLGGVLSTKHPDEWPNVQKYFWRYVSEDHNVDVHQIFALSFNNLPYHLKFCFLYLGLFPEDTIVDAKQLYRMWVAEGFIKLGNESEEVAAEYLKALIDKSLIQIVNRRDSIIISCRIHDLLRDFAIQKSKELNLFHVYDGAVDQKNRRLASHCGFQRLVSLDPSNLHLRSLLVSNPKNESAEIEQLLSICMKLRLLRVLYLEDCPVNHSQQTGSTRLPDEIGKLIHLRYLRLPATRINEFSPFIGNLQALQTIDMGRDARNPISLPDEICKAKQLRHLIGTFKWPFRVDNLTNLLTLNEVVVEGQMEFNPVDLINLRELLVSITGQNNRFTLDSIGGLRSLQSFSLIFGQEDAPLFPPLKPLSHCQHLLELTLWNSGCGWKLPTELHEFLPNVKYLCLVAYSMPEDPMPILEKLPNLTFLELGLYCLNKLACTAGGFPQLQFLQIYGNGAQELQVEEGGIPLLKGLSVLDSVRMPERLRSIPTIPWIYH
ncbi:disease resistance protein RPP13-like [Actinidia eriantha]|uniref:disease resistance protein RPP13-like n=1 Tax=Actinidia eriantha TaxID=165200 RepID=UPI0025825CFD|nr:disease resistance protein RPP13-like [Actinidia eriantha]XP_057502277.1 disease resistance protein RPP13-like [Actinidia eriantha]XP_057502278.1 disease resistance protein RPP13-like [Actinidia eriantha]